MTSTNFIIANIKLLIEILEDGNYHIHEDRTHIEFNNCDDLPPIRNNTDNDTAMQNIINMVSSSTNKKKWIPDKNVNETIYEKKIENDNNTQENEKIIEENNNNNTQEEEKIIENDKNNNKKKEEFKVYKHELKLQEKSKIPILTTTLKNRYIKNNITKRQR